MNGDEFVDLSLGTLLRVENPVKNQLKLVEVHSDSYFWKDAIVRFNYIYGR